MSEPCKKVHIVIICICQGNLHKIKKGTFSFSELNVYPIYIESDTYSSE